jgi:hypothetical protein
MADDIYDDENQTWETNPDMGTDLGIDTGDTGTGTDLGVDNPDADGDLGVDGGGSGGGSVSSYRLSDYPMITYNGSVVKKLQLNGATKYDQQVNTPIDVRLGYSAGPLDFNGKLSTTVLRNMKWAGGLHETPNSWNHVYCFVKAPNGKVGGPGGPDIQKFKLKWQTTHGSAWMRGGNTGYFQSEVGKEGRKETCSKCRNPQTGWIRVDSRQSGYSAAWGNYWFSSFQLHDGNQQTTVNGHVEVFPGNYSFHAGETEHKIRLRFTR